MGALDQTVQEANGAASNCAECVKSRDLVEHRLTLIRMTIGDERASRGLVGTREHRREDHLLRRTYGFAVCSGCRLIKC